VDIDATLWVLLACWDRRRKPVEPAAAVNENSPGAKGGNAGRNPRRIKRIRRAPRRGVQPQADRRWSFREYQKRLIAFLDGHIAGLSVSNATPVDHVNVGTMRSSMLSTVNLVLFCLAWARHEGMCSTVFQKLRMVDSSGTSEWRMNKPNREGNVK